MSLTSFRVKCDWPGCGMIGSFNAGDCLRDYQWVAPNVDRFETKHLCPDHRHKTWVELEQEIDKRNKKEITEEALREEVERAVKAERERCKAIAIAYRKAAEKTAAGNGGGACLGIELAIGAGIDYGEKD